jgi:site-specific DNA-methyltransferase (adenine-specific)
VSEPLSATPTCPTEARVLQGDCLQLLPTLAKEHPSGFSLIYADPPFNTGIAHRVRAGSGLRAQGQAAYHDAWGGLEGFLGMLEPRLAAMRELLTDSGSLWLHLDYRTVHDAKVLGCRLFGPACFQGEIIWVPGNGARRRNAPAVTHQTILIFSRTPTMSWNSTDPELREPHAEGSRKSHFRQLDEQGRRYRERTVGSRTYRYYEEDGRMLGSVWSDCPAMAANTPLSKETTGYPTQKPLKLLRRIVSATTSPGDWVLDPMCGSGTTLVAAQQLGRPAVGLDQSAEAVSIATSRLR